MMVLLWAFITILIVTVIVGFILLYDYLCRYDGIIRAPSASNHSQDMCPRARNVRRHPVM